MKTFEISSRATVGYVRGQLATSIRALVVVLALTILVFGTLIVIRSVAGIAIAEFTRDPLGYTTYPWYKGMVSNLGIIIWSIAVGVSLFVWMIGRKLGVAREYLAMLALGGGLTLVLALDDAFMLHEVVFPSFGIPENVTYSLYVTAMGAFAVIFRSNILQHDALLFLAAMAGFGTSVIADLVSSIVTIPAYYVIEDGGKFFGIVAWCAYMLRNAARALWSADEQPTAEPSPRRIRVRTLHRLRRSRPGVVQRGREVVYASNRGA